MPASCIDCSSLATHRGRCAAHYAAYMDRPTIRKHRKRRAAIAAGNDAAARLRREMRKSVMVTCTRCPARVFASAADVDHIIPLAKGGQDIDSNLQILCRPCHKAKTRVDLGYQTPPF